MGSLVFSMMDCSSSWAWCFLALRFLKKERQQQKRPMPMSRRPPTTHPTTMPAIWPPERPSSELPVEVAEGTAEVEEAMDEVAELLDPTRAEVCLLELGLFLVRREDGRVYRSTCEA